MKSWRIQPRLMSCWHGVIGISSSLLIWPPAPLRESAHWLRSTSREWLSSISLEISMWLASLALRLLKKLLQKLVTSPNVTTSQLSALLKPQIPQLEKLYSDAVTLTLVTWEFRDNAT